MSNSQQCKVYGECLNDLMDYFIITDPRRLSEFQSAEGLGDNLLEAFTTSDSADKAVADGVIVPLSGICNFPYTVHFNTSDKQVFNPDKDDLQHSRDGYVLEVVSGRVSLLTMPLLTTWQQHAESTVAQRPYVELDNGWYRIVINCGETLLSSGWEPTIEFRFEHLSGQPAYAGDISYAFTVSSREY